MQKPVSIKSSGEVKIIGSLFGTPLVVRGRTWLPLVELVTWLGMTWFVRLGHKERSWGSHLFTGGLTAGVILGSEWCHNLAHAAAAAAIDKPMDALQVFWGMPLVYYRDINDRTVTPSQHITRALGGPLLNAALIPLTLLLRRIARPGSTAHAVADAAAKMNIFLSTVSLLPIPGIDGGPILKWSLVEGGRSPAQADEVVRKVNLGLSAGLGAAAGVALKKRSRFLGGMFGLFGVIALAVGLGWLKE